VGVSAMSAEERGLAEVALKGVDVSDDPRGDVCAVPAGTHSLTTATRLDAAMDAAERRLVIVVGASGDAAAHAEEWVASRDGWLLLEAPPNGLSVLASVGTVVREQRLPGRWRGGLRAAHGTLPVSPPAPVAQTTELTRAYSARAALVDTQRLEADRLRAELLAQRAWVLAEVTRVRESLSWRLGHRLVRIARWLTFRPGRGTDALGAIIQRMSTPLDP